MLSNILFGMGIWNILVLSIYGYDKLASKMAYWRISEITLLVLAFLLGGIGAILAMFLFNHKTQKWKFRVLVPMAVISNTFFVGYGLFYWPF